MSKELNELIKELGKIVDGSNQLAEELDTVKKLYEKLKVESVEEFDYPFEYNQRYWSLNGSGDVNSVMWENKSFDTQLYDQGNVFKTKKEAELERDRRALLTRFRQFRDKCNGDWKPDFEDFEADKYSVQFDYYISQLDTYNSGNIDGLYLFGYFKNRTDCDRAIELFGDDIKRLWVDEL